MSHWEKNKALLYGLTERQQHMLLVSFAQKCPPATFASMVREEKLYSIDSALWNEAWRFRNLVEAKAA